jgi:microcystin-dependent protein
MPAGSVTVAADGTVTKSGFAGAIYDQRVLMLAQVQPPGIIPNGPSGYSIKHGLALDATALAMAIFSYLSTGLEAAGTIKLWSAAVAPSGFLLCDGASHLRSTYTDLFTAIGTTFGAADGTHFNVPDLRGRVPLGVGTGDASDATAHTLAQKAGTETHALTTAQMPSHSHAASNSNPEIKFIETTSGTGSLAATAAGTSWSEVPSTDTTGSSDPHNNLPPYLGVSFIIKT